MSQVLLLFFLENKGFGGGGGADRPMFTGSWEKRMIG